MSNSCIKVTNCRCSPQTPQKGFREDLDAKQQLAVVKEHRATTKQRVLLHEHDATRSSREEHRFMLHMLVNEAEKRSPARLAEVAASGCCGLPTTRGCHALHALIDEMMSSADNYARCLGELSGYGLFRAPQVDRMID